MSNSTEGFTDPLRLSKEQRDALLQKLDKLAEQQERLHPSREQNRESPRVEFRLPDMALTVIHPGGSVGKFLVNTRNISETGINFLHNGFLHIGSDVSLRLPTIFGDEVTVQGEIARVSHLTSSLHEIGVKFIEKIDPQRFLKPSEAPVRFSSKPLAAPSLNGEVLHVEDHESDAKLLKHHLRETKIDLKQVVTLKEAIEEITSSPYDLVMTDLELGNGESGLDVIHAVRDAEFAGPIVVVSAETNSAKLREISQAGATQVLTKPYDPARLLTTLSQFLCNNGSIGGNEPVYSEFASDPSMKELIEHFVDEVQESITEINTLIESENLQGLRTVCLKLLGGGSGHGYPDLSTVARNLTRRLDATMSIAESQADIQRLIRYCKRLHAAPA